MKQLRSLSPRGLLLATFCIIVSPNLSIAGTTTCATTAGSTQLDFWLGNWSVGSGGSQATGHSKVFHSLDGCLLMETWGSNTTGHKGENTLAYSADDKSWHGLFVDNHGRVHALHGSVNASSATLEGPGTDADGKPVLVRVKVVRATPDRVLQIWEKSTDSGASWTTQVQMDYSRTKP